MGKSGKELHTIDFHRNQVLLNPKPEHLPTMEDTDVHKLPAMNRLLMQMHQLHAELGSVGLKMQPKMEDVGEKQPILSQYKLTDKQYENWPNFEILLESQWFNPKYGWALHAGFNFHLYVIQDGFERKPGEIADWINIRIKHLSTTPIAFASYREHVKVLKHFGADKSYFDDILMPSATSVSFDRLDDGMNFKTAAFDLAVDDACMVMRKIIARKEFLRVMEEE